MIESMLFMFIKEAVINCSIGNIGYPRGTSLTIEFLPPFRRAKLTYETLSCEFSAFICLMKVEYNSTVEAKSSRKYVLAITCVLQTSISVVLMLFSKKRTLDELSIPA
jgi:hypothetical protein